MPIGKTILGARTGRPTRLTADGYPRVLPIGVSTAWGVVAAAVSNTTLEDGTPVYVGEKALPVGTVMVPVRTAEVQTVTITGAPTGGSFTLRLRAGGRTETTSALPYNATAEQVRAALCELANASKSITVTLAGAVYTITFPATMANVTQLESVPSLTGGATPSVTHATTTQGVATGGQWGPFDSSAADGRQTLERDYVGLLDYTIKQQETSILGGFNDTQEIGLITGGLIWRERLKVGGTNQPTLADLLAVMPNLELTAPE
jgi:hypothetical protein